MISILMPVFNSELWLKDCIESILRQTHQNWELLAVDDYSTDQSITILKDYSKKDGRIKVVSNSGEKGILPALNLAFQYSQGQWITRMDSDDIMQPNKLTALWELCQNEGDLVTGLVSYFSNETLGGGYLSYEKWLNEVLLSGDPFSHIFQECVIPSPCWMIKRADFQKCGGWETGSYPEDYDLCFRFMETGLKVKVFPEVLHQWRDHPGRSSRNLEVYMDQNFFKLKLIYFKKWIIKPQTNVVLWGAGKKGKILAKELKNMDIPFIWTCNNPGKWGHYIQGVQIIKPEPVKEPKVLIAVSAKGESFEDVFNYFGKENCILLYQP